MADGWAGVRATVDVDGALPAVDKALILAAVAATRGRPALLADELARIEKLGGDERLAAVPAVLALARGREAADTFAAAAGIAAERGFVAATPAERTAADATPVEPVPPDAARAEQTHADPPAAGPEEVAAARRSLTPPGAPEPPAIGLLAAHAPAALVGYRGLREAAYEGAGLDPALIELLLFAVMAADYVAPHAGVHAARATAAGAGEGQLVEAGLCAALAAGMGAWLIAAGAIDGLGGD